MHNGYYLELEEIKKEHPDASYGFLENTEVGDYYSLYDFLHGHCDEFAAALSDYYGYEIEYIIDSCNLLVHAYCVTEIGSDRAYIDVRGITTDSELFFEEFEGFCTYDKDSGCFYDLSGECRVVCHKDTCEMYGDENREPNQDKDLVEFFKRNNSYYDVKVFGKELNAMNKDKIMVAVLDDGYYLEHNTYPEEFSSELTCDKYFFDTPEEFVKKWYELDEGAWYWVFVNGEEICSGAIDPGDIEVFKDYFDMSFDGLEEKIDEALDLPEQITISAATLALDTDDMYRDEDLMADFLSDYLSDVYGYCHEGFAFEVIFNNFNVPSEVVVTNIKWDVDSEKDIDSFIDEVVSNLDNMLREENSLESILAEAMNRSENSSDKNEFGKSGVEIEK